MVIILESVVLLILLVLFIAGITTILWSDPKGVVFIFQKFFDKCSEHENHPKRKVFYLNIASTESIT